METRSKTGKKRLPPREDHVERSSEQQDSNPKKKGSGKPSKNSDSLYVCHWINEDETICGYDAGNSKHIFDQHWACHENLREYKCTWKDPKTGKECGMEYNLKQHLKAHERKHTGAKPYVCQELKDDGEPCLKGYSSHTGYTYHYKTQHNKEPPRASAGALKCDWPGCERSFRCADTLKKHKKGHTEISDEAKYHLRLALEALNFNLNSPQEVTLKLKTIPPASFLDSAEIMVMDIESHVTPENPGIELFLLELLMALTDLEVKTKGHGYYLYCLVYPDKIKIGIAADPLSRFNHLARQYYVNNKNAQTLSKSNMYILGWAETKPQMLDIEAHIYQMIGPSGKTFTHMEHPSSEAFTRDVKREKYGEILGETSSKRIMETLHFINNKRIEKYGSSSQS